VGGVFLLSCPSRDCNFREGPKWLSERLFHGREAELREQVDRRRVALGALSPGELGAARGAIEAFRARIAALESAREKDVVVEPECATQDDLEAVFDA
jgi:coenzyme F420-reducing hydrogenase delta subunit